VAILLHSAGRLYLPLTIALTTGLRRGEICGLRWQDVNVARQQLSVRQTLVRVSPGNLQFKRPKTKTGRRAVAMPGLLIEALEAARIDQEGIRAVLGLTYNEEGLVYVREDGRPVDPATLYSNFQKLLQRLGLPKMRLHDLRHSHATFLMEAGVHIKVAAERLGHTDPALTMRVYSHVSDTLQQDAADRTDAILRAALAKDHEAPNT
jgi:integrase